VLRQASGVKAAAQSPLRPPSLEQVREVGAAGLAADLAKLRTIEDELRQHVAQCCCVAVKRSQGRPPVLAAAIAPPAGQVNQLSPDVG